jgi:hypothetical protein
MTIESSHKGVRDGRKLKGEDNSIGGSCIRSESITISLNFSGDGFSMISHLDGDAEKFRQSYFRNAGIQVSINVRWFRSVEI